MKEEEKGEGVILRATPLDDTKQILTAFLPHEGIISLSARVAAPPSLAKLTAAISPLTRSELIYRKTRGEVYKLIDAAVLDDHLALRECGERLDCAGKISRLILYSQLPGKPAPLLYELLSSFLRRLQISLAPKNLVASFFLKFLKHEGQFLWTKTPPREFFDEEWFLMGHIASSRSFQEIEKASVSNELMQKIHHWLGTVTK